MSTVSLLSKSNSESSIVPSTWARVSRNITDGNYMFKVNNRNTRTSCEICSKLTIKTPVPVSLLLALNILTPCSSFSNANFEQVNVG